MPIAKICWIQPEAGGRTTPFSGTHYITVAYFEEGPDKGELEAWSLVVDFQDTPPCSECKLADVRFLVDNAPQYLLHTGSRFTLAEGRRTVATGEIL